MLNLLEFRIKIFQLIVVCFLFVYGLALQEHERYEQVFWELNDWMERDIAKDIAR